MTRKKYEHSAYYYAYHYGWTHSEARTLAGKYIDQHTYRPRMRQRLDGEWSSKEWFKWQNSSKEIDSTFNPLIAATLAAVDIGIAMRDTVRTIADPVERDRITYARLASCTPAILLCPGSGASPQSGN